MENVNKLLEGVIHEQTNEAIKKLGCMYDDIFSRVVIDTSNEIINKLKNDIQQQLNPSMFTENYRKKDISKLPEKEQLNKILSDKEYVIWYGYTSDKKNLEELFKRITGNVGFETIASKVFVTNRLTILSSTNSGSIEIKVIKTGIFIIPNDYIDILCNILTLKKMKCDVEETLFETERVYVPHNGSWSNEQNKYTVEHKNVSELHWLNTTFVCYGQHSQNYKPFSEFILTQVETLKIFVDKIEDIIKNFFGRHSVDYQFDKLIREINEFENMRSIFYSETGLERFNKLKKDFEIKKSAFESELEKKKFTARICKLNNYKKKLIDDERKLAEQTRVLDAEINSFRYRNRIKKTIDEFLAE